MFVVLEPYPLCGLFPVAVAIPDNAAKENVRIWAFLLLEIFLYFLQKVLVL